MFSLESPLQTDAWAKVQRKLGKPTSTVQGDGWSALCVEEKRAVGSYLYVPYGPICRDAGALDDALRAIHAHARRRRAWWVRVEPRSSEREALWSDLPLWRDVLEADRFHPALHDHQPKHTRLIDLTAGPDAILAAATGSIRTIHRNHAKKGLEVRTSRNPDDVTILAAFLSQAAGHKHIVARSASYLHAVASAMMPVDAATLYSTWKDGAPLCATLVYDSPTQRLFAHAAMPVEHRKLRPNQPLITRALLDAHDAGIRTADLFGLAPPDEPNHPWAGFSAFKRSFGGEDVTHLGTWERDIVPGARRALEAREHLAERRQTQRARGPEATADSSAPVASTVPTTASAENSSVPH